MSEAGESVKRALQSLSSVVGNVVQQQCTIKAEKEEECKEEKSRRSKCKCNLKCTCSTTNKVVDGKVEPQLILLQILG